MVIQGLSDYRKGIQRPELTPTQIGPLKQDLDKIFMEFQHVDLKNNF